MEPGCAVSKVPQELTYVCYAADDRCHPAFNCEFSTANLFELLVDM